MWKSIFSAFFWTSGEGRARRSPVVHYLDFASLAWGFLIFFRIPMRVVKSDWNPHPHACRKRRLCRKRDCLTCLFHYPAFIHICLLGCVHPWRVWLAKQETLTPPGHLVSPLVLGRNQGSLHAHYSSQSFQRTLRNAYGVVSPTVGTTSSVRLHICAVTCVTETSLHVTLNTFFFKCLNNPFGDLPFWLPFGASLLGVIIFVASSF